MIVHNYNGTLVFSQYAHLQTSIPVRVGQDVDTNTVIKNEINDDLGTDNNNIKDYNDSLNDNIKKIRINNAFASASKEKKKIIINKWNDLIKKTTDIQYSSLAGIINDIDILVVGTNNIIFLVKYESLIYRIYNYENDLKKLLFDVFNIDYNFVFLVEDEWIYQKKQYISKLKNGIKFEIIDEDFGDNNKSDNIESESNIDKIVSIFGNDIITYK